MATIQHDQSLSHSRSPDDGRTSSIGDPSKSFETDIRWVFFICQPVAVRLRSNDCDVAIYEHEDLIIDGSWRSSIVDLAEALARNPAKTVGATL